MTTQLLITMPKGATMFDPVVSVIFDGEEIFNAIIKNDEIVVRKNIKTNNLLSDASVKDGTLTIPNFITLHKIADNQYIISNDQVVERYSIFLNGGIIFINNVDIRNLNIIAGKTTVIGKLVAQTIKTNQDLYIHTTGVLKADNVYITNGTMNNNGKVDCGRIKIKYGKYFNAPTGVIAANLKIIESAFENKGTLCTHEFVQRTDNTIKDAKGGNRNLDPKKPVFNNSGTWAADGLVDFGSTLFYNSGTITWSHVNFKLERSMYGHRNKGTWTFYNVNANEYIFISNHGEMHLMNSILQFNWLLNGKKLIISSGKYYIYGLQNNGLISFIDNEFTFDEVEPDADNYLWSDGFGPVGTFESEKDLMYNHPTLPNKIVCQENLYISSKCKDRQGVELNWFENSKKMTKFY